MLRNPRSRPTVLPSSCSCALRRRRCRTGWLVLVAGLAVSPLGVPEAGAQPPSKNERNDASPTAAPEQPAVQTGPAAPWTLDLTVSLAPSGDLRRDLPHGTLDLSLDPCYGLAAHLSYRVASLLDLGVRLEAIRWALQSSGEDLWEPSPERLAGVMVDLTVGPRLRVPLAGGRAELMLTLPCLGLSFEALTGEGQGSGSGGVLGVEAGAILHLSPGLGVIVEAGRASRFYAHSAGDGASMMMGMDSSYFRAGITL